MALALAKSGQTSSLSTYKFRRNIFGNEIHRGELERDGLLLGRVHLALHLEAAALDVVDVEDLEPRSEVGRAFPFRLLLLGFAITVQEPGVRVRVSADIENHDRFID